MGDFDKAFCKAIVEITNRMMRALAEVSAFVLLVVLLVYFL